ncbi:MAG: hypothetical protein P8J37_25120, partial [Fuerstiella sp.]|nr:hypothetical protein [Fuerstiella sp.]
ITMECWPRNVDITSSAAEQYPGWPRTISQFDNYNPPSWGKLGKLTFDVENPVVQLIHADTNEILYTVRANGRTFTPAAPKNKAFIVKVGRDAPDNIISVGMKAGSAPLKVTFN